jgi:hypothetical protein
MDARRIRRYDRGELEAAGRRHKTRKRQRRNDQQNGG